MFNKIKLSPAQTLITHVLISGLVSAVLAGLVAAFQYISVNGFDLKDIWSIFATAFIASFSACYLSIKSNPQLAQAELDTLQQIHTAATSTIPQMLQSINQPVQAAPLVVVHAAQAQTESGTPPETEQPTAPQPNMNVRIDPQTGRPIVSGWSPTLTSMVPTPQTPQSQFVPQQPFQRNWDTGLVPTVGPNQQPGQ